MGSSVALYLAFPSKSPGQCTHPYYPSTLSNVRPQLSICPYPCSLVFTVTSRCRFTRLLACFIFRFQNESRCSLGCTSPPRHAKAVIRDLCLLTCTAIVPKSRKVAQLSHDVMLLDQMLMAPFSCFLYRGVHDAGAYCNLSRSYRGLVFSRHCPLWKARAYLGSDGAQKNCASAG